MGGKSKSTKTTSSTQNNTNIVNDGQFAGAGDVVWDESQTDNSVSIENEIDNSLSLDDSFNTDNSVSIENDGDYAGNSGNIVLSDSGAIEAAQAIAENSLLASMEANAQAAQTTQAALDANASVTSDAFDFGSQALDEMQVVATSAVDSVEHFGSNAIDSLNEMGSATIEQLTDQSIAFGDNLSSVTDASISANERVLANAAQANSDDKEIIAQLAKSTSLAGQDIVAKSSERMTMYMAIAVGVGFVAMVVFGGKR